MIVKNTASTKRYDTVKPGLDAHPHVATRNSVLRCTKVLFSFAESRSYLPSDRSTEAEKVALVKVKRDDPAVFTSEHPRKPLDAADEDLIPILAIGGFAGIRMAELDRLDWTAVELHRRIIETRYWAVYVDGELLAVVLYRKGAEAIADALMDLAHPQPWRARVAEE